MGTEPIYSFASLQNRLRVHGNLVALTGLRIGAGRSSNIIGNDLPVLRDALGAPFVPGASLKGAFRARVESLVRAVAHEQELPSFTQLDTLSKAIVQARRNRTFSDEFLVQEKQKIKPDGAALDLEQLEDRTRSVRGFLSQNRELSDADVSDIIWRQSSLIDLTFGSPELAGRIFFKDALVDRSLWFDQYEIRNGVALNRDTETVEQGLLYDYEVVPAGVRFAFELVLENAAPWQLGMVLLALRPWQNGDVQIGGFRSRGLGHIQLDDMRASYSAIEGDDTATRVDAILSLLGHGDAPATSDISLEAGSEPLHTWIEAFKRALINPTSVIGEGAIPHA